MEVNTINEIIKDLIEKVACLEGQVEYLAGQVERLQEYNECLEDKVALLSTKKGIV